MNTEERDWRAWAEEMERQRDRFRDEAKTLTAALTGDTWAWQGDDAEDQLDSMGDGMIVAIRADQLRALIRDEPVQQIARELRGQLPGEKPSNAASPQPAQRGWVDLNAEDCNRILFQSEDVADAIASTSRKLVEKNT